MANLTKIFHKSNKLVLIIALAAILRIALLSKVPPALNWDEVSMGYSAYSILETGKDEWGEPFPLLFRSYGEWKSPFYIYAIIPFIKAFGLNAWSVRLPAALAGIASVYLTYLIAKKIFNHKTALFSAFFLAVSPWHLMLSRPAYEAGVALMFILLGIYTLLLFEKSRMNKHLLISALAFGIAPHTYNSAKIVMPLIVLFLLYNLRNKINKRKILAYISILVLFALPVISAMISGEAQSRYSQVGITTDQELTTNFYKYRKTFPLPPLLNRAIFSKYTFFAVKLVDNWGSYFSPNFLLTSGGSRPQHNIPYRGVLYFSEFALLLIGAHTLLRSKVKMRFLPLVLIAFGFLPAALTKDPYHVLRSILTLPGWQILAGLGATTALTKWKKVKSISIRKIIFSALSFEVILFLFLYFTWYPKAFARDWQYGYKEAIEYATSNQDKYDQIYFTKWYGEPQLFLAFYSKMDPQLYQKENKGLIRYEEMGLPWLDQINNYKINQYNFQYNDWQGQGDNHRNLYVGKWDDFWLDTPILKTIYFPDGSVAFHIVEGQ